MPVRFTPSKMASLPLEPTANPQPVPNAPASLIPQPSRESPEAILSELANQQPNPALPQEPNQPQLQPEQPNPAENLLPQQSEESELNLESNQEEPEEKVQKPSKRSRPHPSQEDPLSLLLDGPLSPSELVDNLDVESLLPERSLNQVELMLSNLERKEGILVPSWWEGSPQLFRSQFLNLYMNTANSLSTGLTSVSEQLLTLETLLSMWGEALSEKESTSMPPTLMQ